MMRGRITDLIRSGGYFSLFLLWHTIFLPSLQCQKAVIFWPNEKETFHSAIKRTLIWWGAAPTGTHLFSLFHRGCYLKQWDERCVIPVYTFFLMSAFICGETTLIKLFISDRATFAWHHQHASTVCVCVLLHWDIVLVCPMFLHLLWRTQSSSANLIRCLSGQQLLADITHTVQL